MTDKSRILHLTLHGIWFDLIAKGTKTVEYRDFTPYWRKRLEGKTFDVIHFRNGYSMDRPFMVVECGEITTTTRNQFAINLGKVLETKNWDGVKDE